MRISVSALESWRLYLSGDWMTLEQLRDSVLGKTVENRPMLIGKALEEIIACPGAYGVQPHGYVNHGYCFDSPVLDEALTWMAERPMGCHQVKLVPVYAGHQVPMVADYIIGSEIHDWKTSEKAMEADHRLGAYQPKFYLDGFGGSSFTFHHFKINDHKNSVIDVKSVERITLYPYPGLREECERIVREFAAFAEAQGWAEELTKREKIHV